MSNPDGAHPNVGELRAFARGGLESADRAAIERHLNACPACARRLTELPADTISSPGRDYAPTADTALGIVASAEVDETPPALRDHPRYRVLGLIGRGGMGVVYRAEHRLMARTVALKILHPHLTGRQTAVERFRLEARAAARLAHPNIVTAHDAEQAGDAHFLVMEYVEGETLDRVLRRRGRVGVAEACEWVRQAALGMQYAHESGMVHRDVKPSNLILTPEGRVKVLDFGLAQLAQPDTTDPGITPDGVLLGTPAYLAPEQASDPGAADVRSDIYSLGCTLYHLLAGAPPFPAGTPMQQVLAHRDRPAPSLSAARPDVPAALDRLVHRMLAKSPAARPQTPAEVAQALEAFAAGTAAAPRPRRRWPLIAAMALVLVVVGAGALLWLLWPREDAAPRVEGQPPPLRPEAPAQAELWLKANNAFGPDHLMAADIRRQIDEQLTKGQGFVVRLGRKLVSSEKATLLAGRNRDLAVFEFTEHQVGIWIAAAVSDRYFTDPQPEEYHPRPPVELSDLKIDVAGLAPGRNLTGEVAYRGLDPAGGPVLLRLTCAADARTRTVSFVFDKAPAEKAGRLRFSLPPLFQAEEMPSQAPMVVFLELGQPHPPGGEKTRIVSNTLMAALLFRHGQVVAPAAVNPIVQAR